MSLFYCDERALLVCEVVILPRGEFDPPLRTRLHDVGVDPRNWYYVDPERVKPTAAHAIWAAKEALDSHDREIYQEMQKLQEQRDEISRLQQIGDPENDGT